jgi:adenylate kinase
VNKGQLVSDEVINDLLSKRLEKGQTKGETGFILNGQQSVCMIFDLLKIKI